ncbi:hypothetical protein HNP84_000239 [Thermocatellispora tengchongensis]|uniref:Uncharacterized protein n=1 Tax=Thermocatellispora tengchongensis TaxID=1073253 RepID=A0A840NY15_9ACTN|nr:hypothetical protein [Thermocatellispora tengchongensis]MBB5130551.1 hypothetical protein [Thermocatellispora tengchongensis]
MTFEAACRAAAADLDQLEPYWHVLYGVASRRFFALPLWNAPRGLYAQARNVQDLIAEMRTAEDVCRAGMR